MKLIILIIFCFASYFVQAQSSPGPDGRLMRDTNRLVYNEQGSILKYGDYKNLIASGEYAITFSGDPLLPGTKSILKKLTEDDKKRKEDVISGFILNAGVLKLNSQLDATPMALAMQRDLFKNKVILMVFSNPGCLACADMFTEINSALAEYEPDSIVVLLITEATEEKAAEVLARKPLANARVIGRARALREFYGITGLPAFVITDKYRTIRYNGFGIGPSKALKVKNVLIEMNNKVPDGYYSLSYDQKHLILSVKALNLMKEKKYKEALQVYDSLFIHSMGKGLQQDFYNAASAWAKLGDVEKAFYYLQQAVLVTKYQSLSTLNSEANFLKLKSDKRWKTIIEQVNLNFKANAIGNKKK